MRRDNILRKKKVTFGSWLTLGSCQVAEIMAGYDFDWLVVDMEHSAITLDKARDLIRVIEGAGVVPLVRVGENNANLIKRVMDAGSCGVIVPMVNTKEDAQNAVAAVKYPPCGRRGVGLARAQGYGFNFDEYKKWVDRESIVIVQIEHIEAVDNLEDIFSVRGVDGFIIGPYDLSGSLGKPGDFDDAQVKKALARIMEVARNYPVVPGFHVIPPQVQEVLKKIEEGYRFMGFSLDSLFLGSKISAELSKLPSQGVK